MCIKQHVLKIQNPKRKAQPMKKQISYALTLITLTSSVAFANFNETCRLAYRQGSVELMKNIELLKDKNMSLNEFALTATAINAEVKATRAACYIGEDAANKECVSKYNEVYKDISSKVNSISILLGNQKEIDMSLFDTLKAKAKISFIDNKCK